jgi:predicted TPR repeat methyltransferase
MEQEVYFRAVQAATQAVALAPNWRAARLTLGRAQLHFGELLVCITTLREALALPSQAGDTRKLADEIRFANAVSLW